jgi:hypothetical protein
MTKKYLLLILIIASYQVFSQEVYLKTGMNLSKYRYQISNGGSDLNFMAGSGSFYELGVAKAFTNKHFVYSIGLALDQYNAVAGSAANSYRWDTKYVGVKSGLACSFSPHEYSLDNKVDFLLNLGFKGQSIFYGKQETNGVYYDLAKEKGFSGILLSPSVGFQVKYSISSLGFLSLGYDFCHSVNVTNTTAEKLTFSTHQIGLGIHLPIN